MLDLEEAQAKGGLDQASLSFQQKQQEHANAYTHCQHKEDKIRKLREQMKVVQGEQEKAQKTRTKLEQNAQTAAEHFQIKLHLLAQAEEADRERGRNLALKLNEVTQEWDTV